MNERDTRPRIVCAAIRYEDGFLLIGARHFDLIMHATLAKIKAEDSTWAYQNAVQGFIDQFGKFYTREEAYIVAKEMGQYNPWGSHHPGVLYSEDLY